MENDKTTKLNVIKISLDNKIDPSITLENDYFRVRLVYKYDNVSTGTHVKEGFMLDAVAKNILLENIAPYLAGTYEFPQIIVKPAVLTAYQMDDYMELLQALYQTIEEIQDYLDENY